MATARAILARGDCVVIFPEGTRMRGGPLRSPHRGVGRLALETGAPVVPVAVIGTDTCAAAGAYVRARCAFGAAAPLAFPRVESPLARPRGRRHRARSGHASSLQWEWLGGAQCHGRRAQLARPAPARAPAAGAQRPVSRRGRVRCVREQAGEAQGAARRRVLGSVPGASARRLQLCLLPGRQPPRRRGSDRADLPAGLSALRARPAGIATVGRCDRG